MSRILVVYYSRTGITRRVAEALAARLQADLDPIREVRSRSGILGYLRSAREALRQRIVDITPSAKDPGDYDLVVLGAPVWGHNLCSPMRSYIAAHRHRLRAIAIFCTQGGSGGDTVARQTAQWSACTPVATLVLNQSAVLSGASGAKLDAFADAIAPAQAA